MSRVVLLALLSTPAVAGDSTLDEFGSGSVEDPAGLEIINGTQATPDQWPETGGLIAQSSGTFFGQAFHSTSLMCSSTLIAPDVVLLAAHCVDKEVLESMGGQIDELEFFWSREIDLASYSSQEAGAPLPPDAVAVWDAPMHPSWVGAQTIGLGVAENNDIALIFLSEAQLDVPYAYLPTAAEAAQVVTDAPVTIVGWGHQRQIGQWEQPPAGSTGIKHVASTFIGEIGPPEFQVGRTADEGRKCHGDSGGPTFMEVTTDSSEATRLIGVTSHAYDETDCNEKGGVDTRVDFYLDWIDQEMRARCADGTRAWCDEEGIIPPPQPKSEDPEEEELRACGCQSDQTSAAFLPLLLGALALGLRRRRRA